MPTTSLAPETTAIPSTTSPAKTLMLVGGAWQYPATEDPYGVSIYLDFLQRSGGVENAKIGIFTSASSSAARAQENGELYVQDFQDLYDLYLKDQFPNSTIQVEWIPFHIENCEQEEDNPALIEQVNRYTGFIFGGGDQSLITECFFDEDPLTGTRTETPIFQALKQRYEQGAVVAGTSARTAVQSIPMITEGESYEALLDGSTSLIGSPPFVRDLYYNPLGGLGFFDYGLLDTHFSERGRQGRITRLAADLDVPLTFGVDENTALVVTQADTPDVSMQVLGQGGVFISDLSQAEVDTSLGDWSIDNVRATYLTEGDQYNPLTKTATFPDKAPVTQPDGTLLPNDNVFSWKDPETGDWTDPRSLTTTAIELVTSAPTTTTGLSYEREPVPYGITLSETQNAQGYIGTDSQGQEKISFANLQMDIAPVQVTDELLDLRSQTGTVAASFEISRDALYLNTVGFYAVQDVNGTVLDPVTGKLLSPGDMGYAAAALRQSQSGGASFVVTEQETVAAGLEGGSLYAPFLIANGTVEQVLNDIMTDDPGVFFSFIAADAFRSDHIQLLAPGRYGFEDLLGGGDLDYNDAIVQVEF